MVVLGCGMGDSDAKAGRLRIGITVYDMTSFITQGKEGISRYAALHNLRVLWNSANNDVSTQAAQVDQLVNAEVDAIM
ncbi:xylitol/threitol ABC transporter substrate-binding protein, partial [Mycobacteroides abscessus subsp. massiliense]